MRFKLPDSAITTTSGFMSAPLYLVSTSGVVASDTTGVGTTGFSRSFAEYGSGLGMFIYGNGTSLGYSNYTNRVSNTGVVASNGQSAGTEGDGRRTSDAYMSDRVRQGPTVRRGVPPP